MIYLMERCANMININKNEKQQNGSNENNVKIIVCDDKTHYLNYNFLSNAFKQVFPKGKLLYFTFNEVSTSQDDIYKIFEHTENGWVLQHTEDCNMDAVFNNGYILLDTKWSDYSVIKEDIIAWCSKNRENYKRVYVYTNFGMDEAKNLVDALKENNIKVFDEAKSVIPTMIYEQQNDFVDLFLSIKNDKTKRD